jgi:hypothetical protein
MPNQDLIPSQPITAALVAIVLFVLGRLVIRHVSETERDPWLAKALTVCLLLHLIFAPLQIWVVDHLYGGVADYNRYDGQGAILATGFRHFDFSLAPANLGGIVSNGAVSIVVGVVFTIVGTNQAAAFLVFSWLAFVGVIYFYRAFTLTFSKEGSRRYGYLVFFLPSLLFWTSDVSKESLMVFCLGFTAYGCARILARRKGGYLLVIASSVGGAFIRPNETLLAVGGLTIAMFFRPSSERNQFEPGRRSVGLIFLVAMLGLAIFVTLHFLPSVNGSISPTTVTRNNSGTGAGFGSSGVAYSGNPIYYPRDVFTVLFDPLPFNAHGSGEWLEAAENMVVVGALLASFRQIRMLPRAMLARPYLIMCLFFTASFAYFFAALGNLGLITREASVVLPFFLVLLCVPRGPRHRPPRYIWELSRRERMARRRAEARRASPRVPRRAVPA